MSATARNFCYFLWKGKIKRRAWAEQLSAWAGCDSGRARMILSGGDPTDDELERISDRLRFDPADLRYQDFLNDDNSVDILKENLCRLIESLPHGSKAELAKTLGVRDFTLSRWLAGKQKPPQKKIEKIKEIFHVPPQLNLSIDPLFMEFEPISIYEKKEWLHRQIEKMDGTKMEQMFPSLKKILE